MDRYGVLEDDPDELYFRIGIGLVKINDLDKIVSKSENSSGPKQWLAWFKNKGKKGGDFVINDAGGTSHKYVIAQCCNPIPGDSVVGFLGPDGSVTVHKKSCPVANSIAAKHGDRIVVPEWKNGETATSSFLVRLSLKGFDRLGIINEIL